MSISNEFMHVIDYIFSMPPAGRKLKVLGILEPPAEEDFGAGLPRKGVCGSDHISIRAHIGWAPE